MSGFRRIGERLLYQGRKLTLVMAAVTTPDGDTVEREIVHHPGAVAVVAVVDGAEGPEVVLVRQYRAALDALLLELPAGTRDVEGEDPRDTAVRELREEVGLEASGLEHLVGFHNSPGFCDELLDVYLTRSPGDVAHERQGAEEHAMTVERVPLAAVPAMIADGRITDAKTIIGLLLARDHLAHEARAAAGPEPGRGPARSAP